MKNAQKSKTLQKKYSMTPQFDYKNWIIENKYGSLKEQWSGEGCETNL